MRTIEFTGMSGARMAVVARIEERAHVQKIYEEVPIKHENGCNYDVVSGEMAFCPQCGACLKPAKRQILRIYKEQLSHGLIGLIDDLQGDPKYNFVNWPTVADKVFRGDVGFGIVEYGDQSVFLYVLLCNIDVRGLWEAGTEFDVDQDLYDLPTEEDIVSAIEKINDLARKYHLEIDDCRVALLP